MQTFADFAASRLETAIRAVDTSAFLWLDRVEGERCLVRAPGSSEPFLVPYLPFIGRQYEPDGVLLYATAQSFSERSDKRDFWWGRYVGFGDDALFRLYRQECLDPEKQIYRFSRRPSGLKEVAKDNISIAPYASGILPAIAGLLLYAFSGEPIKNLDDVTDQIAVTNLYKFTLLRPNNRDLNPKCIADSELRIRYARETMKHFVSEEIKTLQPRFVLGFNVPAWRELRRVLSNEGHARAFTVQDPASIQRGWRHPTWTQQLAANPLAEEARQLVECYVEQCESYWRDSKRDKVALLLAGWMREFQIAAGDKT